MHQIEALKNVGVDEVVLAINYQPKVMMSFIEEYEKKLGVKIVCSKEDSPMGTAGPLALARSILDDGSGDPFFVLNSDVICEYPLQQALDLFKSKGEAAEGLIMVTKVEDPSKCVPPSTLSFSLPRSRPETFEDQEHPRRSP